MSDIFSPVPCPRMASLSFPLLVRHQAGRFIHNNRKTNIFKLTFAFLNGEEDMEDSKLNAVYYVLN